MGNNQDTFNKGRLSKTAVMSTIVSRGKFSSPTLIKNNSKHTTNSRASRYSINSKNEDFAEEYQAKAKSGRATQVESRSRFGKSEKIKSNKSHDLVKSKSNDRVLKQQNKDENDEFSIDSFLEQKWERKRTHHSPDDDKLRKPRRKSNWKCDLQDLRAKEIKMEYTLKKLGLEAK